MLNNALSIKPKLIVFDYGTTMRGNVHKLSKKWESLCFTKELDSIVGALEVDLLGMFMSKQMLFQETVRSKLQ